MLLRRLEGMAWQSLTSCRSFRSSVLDGRAGDTGQSHIQDNLTYRETVKLWCPYNRAS